jgi:BON domain
MANTSNVIEKAGKLARDVAGAAEGVARQAGGSAKGLRHRVQSSPAKSLSDVTLSRKVETVLFRDSRAPKNTVLVNTADGVVYLRGTVRRPEQIKTLEAAVTRIPEVRAVENLLHLNKTPAPTRADTPRSQQKTRATKPRSTSPRAAKRTERVNTDKTTARGEPTPKQLAKSGSGRRPAPLGAKGSGSARTKASGTTKRTAAASGRTTPKRASGAGAKRTAAKATTAKRTAAKASGTTAKRTSAKSTRAPAKRTPAKAAGGTSNRRGASRSRPKAATRSRAGRS